ncbi:hypothetical protein CYMTET_36831 [Cymbomonas tetramitiformis]|uniref:Uncharacterized protein n=1 Tax=Cymbomonas tetramitiformis TaxID=36881 RepID=A0AAE0CGK2_9CHLO|nr:hypothetical protein CYMTET_36831 [Cymbomonas tetramitiformis]
MAVSLANAGGGTAPMAMPNMAQTPFEINEMGEVSYGDAPPVSGFVSPVTAGPAYQLESNVNPDGDTICLCIELSGSQLYAAMWSKVGKGPEQVILEEGSQRGSGMPCALSLPAVSVHKWLKKKKRKRLVAGPPSAVRVGTKAIQPLKPNTPESVSQLPTIYPVDLLGLTFRDPRVPLQAKRNGVNLLQQRLPEKVPKSDKRTIAQTDKGGTLHKGSEIVVELPCELMSEENMTDDGLVPFSDPDARLYLHPEEATALILSHAAHCAAAARAKPGTKGVLPECATLVVPGSFGVRQREAAIEAVTDAGLTPLRIFDSGLAAVVGALARSDAALLKALNSAASPSSEPETKDPVVLVVEVGAQRVEATVVCCGPYTPRPGVTPSKTARAAGLAGGKLCAFSVAGCAGEAPQDVSDLSVPCDTVSCVIKQAIAAAQIDAKALGAVLVYAEGEAGWRESIITAVRANAGEEVHCPFQRLVH